jgi:hypothetical protein
MVKENLRKQLAERVSERKEMNTGTLRNIIHTGTMLISNA